MSSFLRCFKAPEDRSFADHPSRDPDEPYVLRDEEEILGGLRRSAGPPVFAALSCVISSLNDILALPFGQLSGVANLLRWYGFSWTRVTGTSCL
jgi:hypothetical protein